MSRYFSRRRGSKRSKYLTESLERRLLLSSATRLDPHLQLTPSFHGPGDSAPVLDDPGPITPYAPPLNGTIEAVNFDSDATASQYYQTPPDGSAAAGPNHVVNVVNSVIQWFTRAGTLQNTQRLGMNATTSAGSFFAAVSPLTTCFDPKVIYDQYNNRFVVVALEETDTASGAPANTSRIFVAVSDDADPNGTWYVRAINSKLNIGGVDRLADFPGLAIDSQAVYITANMFSFGSGVFGGSRLWILNKTGWYSNGALSANVFDPSTSAGLPSQAFTLQPAHMFGAAPGSTGTFLISSGWTDAGTMTDDRLNVIRVDNPLAVTPGFSSQFLSFGNIDNNAAGVPDAPQSGTGIGVDAGDKRALNAVWRNNALWTCNTIVPVSGTDAGQATAHWYKINTTNLGALAAADQGNVGGENIAAGTYTFFPAVMVDATGDLGIGFSASAPTIFPGAYYTGRGATDAAGTVQPTATLAAGVAFYDRNLGPGFRWGDFSSISIDPNDGLTFWVYNQYASSQGTPGVGSGTGRWATRYGNFIFPTTVTGTVFWDFNNNNVLDAGESGLGGIIVWVDLNNNFIPDGGEPVTASTADGTYTLANVPFGTWTMREQPNTFVPTNAPRTLVSGGGTLTGVDFANITATYNGTAGNDNYLLRLTPAGTQFQIIVTGGPTYLIPTGNYALQFNLGAGDDSLTVDYVNGVPIPSGAVTYDGGTHTAGDSLIVTGTAGADTFTLNNGSVNNNQTVFYGNVEAVTLNTLAGNDTVYVTYTGTPTNINAGDNDDTVAIGNGSMDNIAAVTLSGGNGNDAIYLNDSTANFSDTYIVASTTVSRIRWGGLTYATLESLNISGETGNNIYQIESTASGTSTSITDYGGNDTFNLGPIFHDIVSIQGPLSIDGGGGTDSIATNDSGAPNSINFTYTITSNSLSRDFFAGLTYANTESLSIIGDPNSDSTYHINATNAALSISDGGGNELYNINSTSGTLNITDGAGNDNFYVGTGNLDSLAGAVSLNAGPGNDTVYINDSLAPYEDTYTFNLTTFTRAFFGGLTYVNEDSIVMYGESGDNVYNVVAVPAALYISDSGGHDTYNIDECGGVLIYPSGGDDDVNVNTSGFNNSYVYFPGVQRVGPISIGNGGDLILYAGSGAVLTATSLAIASNGRLDMADGAMIIDYSGSSPTASIQGYLTTGYAAGAWNGNGIDSSTAAATPGTAVGFGEATDLFTSFPASFAGQSIDNTSVLLHWTLYGDANLNKTVDTIDFSILAANFGGTGKRWSKGDFNFNGSTETVDFNLLVSKFSQSLAAPTANSVQLPLPAVAPRNLFSSRRIPNRESELLA